MAQGAQFAAAPAVEEEGGEQQYEERYYCQSKSGKVKKVYEERQYCQSKERERLISIAGALPGTR